MQNVGRTMNTGLRVTVFRDFAPCSLEDVSEDPSAFVFFLEDGKIKSPPNQWYPSIKQHGVTYQKLVIFILKPCEPLASQKVP
jgi:hypothetical protein